MTVFNCTEEELHEVSFHCTTLPNSSSRAISIFILLLNEKYLHKILEPRLKSLPTQGTWRIRCALLSSKLLVLTYNLLSSC